MTNSNRILIGDCRQTMPTLPACCAHGRYIDPAWSHAIIASALDGEA